MANLDKIKVGETTYDIADSKARNEKQDALVSGENIKTINGESLLGSGDITISGGSNSGVFDECITIISRDDPELGSLNATGGFYKSIINEKGISTYICGYYPEDDPNYSGEYWEDHAKSYYFDSFLTAAAVSIDIKIKEMAMEFIDSDGQTQYLHYNAICVEDARTHSNKSLKFDFGYHGAIACGEGKYGIIVRRGKTLNEEDPMHPYWIDYIEYLYNNELKQCIIQTIKSDTEVSAVEMF